jgi:hypothetical protein
MTKEEYFSLNTLPKDSYVYAYSSGNFLPGNGRFAIGILKFKDGEPWFEKICGTLTNRKNWPIICYENYSIVSKEEALLKIFEG